jgi:hypothetical protein
LEGRLKINTLQKWALIGIVETLLSLSLIATAPRFLNSNRPEIGFLIWLSVLSVTGGSGTYAVWRLSDAGRARQILLTKFPEYAHLGITEFLELKSTDVIKNLPILEAMKDDPDWQALQITPIDFLRRAKRK